MGLLFSAFFWSYSVFQLAAGWLVDRYDVKHVFSAGFLLWCLATASVGLITGFGWLLCARVMLGIGESVAYPAYSRILARDFPENRRGLANALVDAGSKIGPALSTLGGRASRQPLRLARLVRRHGNRGITVAVAVGLSRAFRPDARLSFGNPEQPIRMVEILRRREAWGTYLGMFCLGYVWYFLISWLPSYLVTARGLSMQSMAVLGSLPFWAMAATSVLGGWFSDRLIRRGASVTRVRKTFVTGGLLLCCVTLLAGGSGSQRRSLGPATGRQLLRTWVVHLECLGDHPDSGGTTGRRFLDRHPERDREPGRRNFTGSDRSCGRTDRLLLSGVCASVDDAARRRRFVSNPRR